MTQQDIEMAGPEEVAAAKKRRDAAERQQKIETLVSLAEVADLPLFEPLVMPDEVTWPTAIEALVDGIYLSRRSVSKAALGYEQLQWVDRETGMPRFAKLKVNYEPNHRRLRREALRLVCLGLRSRKATAQDVASLLFYVLWEALKPGALKVQVKPLSGKADVAEAASVQRSGESTPVYDTHTELIRLHLTLSVPQAINRLLAHGGPTDDDAKQAAKHVRDLIASRKLESAPGELAKDLLEQLTRALAIASFRIDGISAYGLHWESDRQLDVEAWIDGQGDDEAASEED